MSDGLSEAYEERRWDAFCEANELRLEVDQLAAENAKLRDELAKWERLTDGIDLPEYPISQFVPKDLERENSALRELVRDICRAFMHGKCNYISDGRCQWYDRMRDLGIEVD